VASWSPTSAKNACRASLRRKHNATESTIRDVGSNEASDVPYRFLFRFRTTRSGPKARLGASTAKELAREQIRNEPREGVSSLTQERRAKLPDSNVSGNEINPIQNRGGGGGGGGGKVSGHCTKMRKGPQIINTIISD